MRLVGRNRLVAGRNYLRVCLSLTMLVAVIININALPMQMLVTQRSSECLYELLDQGYVNFVARCSQTLWDKKLETLVIVC